MTDDSRELTQRIRYAKGQIMEALGDLSTVSNIPEVHRAERALRYAVAELNGTARLAMSSAASVSEVGNATD